MAAVASPPSLHTTRSADMLRSTMNKFLKKKTAEGPAPSPSPIPMATNDEALNALSSGPPTSPVLKKPGTNRWRRKKEPEVQAPAEVAMALPALDDLRTSLLMPKLSARFSMLREQDDPHSLLGKASDDSVLQPRRRSRLMDLGFAPTGLTDIAEISSIKSSIRPPFAAYGRQDSYASEDGYASEADLTPGGSIMTRARPGEGNNMFGGRQRIYKINGNQSSQTLGRALYEDDIGWSAFQRHRQRQREIDFVQPSRPSDDSIGFQSGPDQAGSVNGEDMLDANLADSAKDLSHSPSFSSYDKKRSTASSTARSEASMSTAATSVASQPLNSSATSPALGATQSVTAAQVASSQLASLERSNTKTRRLYEHGLDQHMLDQQATALTRLNSLQRPRPPRNGKQSPPFLHGAKSVGNLRERPPQPAYAVRSQSPSLAVNQPAPIFGSAKKQQPSGINSTANVPRPIVEPPTDQPDVWVQALEPGDRGKATAMGAFNRPQHSFDEQQYLERQKQLQRSNSNTVAPSPPRAQRRLGRFEFDSQQPLFSPYSNARSPSASRRAFTPEGNTSQDASNQTAVQFESQQADKAALPDTHRTFFGDISASDSEEENDEARTSHDSHPSDYSQNMYQGRWQPRTLPSVSEHPAFRNQKPTIDIAEEAENLQPAPLRTSPSSYSPTKAMTQPTLGDGLDSSPKEQHLNSLVHHLRQTSNQSSVYPNDESTRDEIPDMPNLDNINGRSFGNTLDVEAPRDSLYASSNPWDLDENEIVSTDRPAGDRSSSPLEGVQGSSTQDERDSEEFTEPPSWQHQLRKEHSRDPSSATQHERDAFASELAARRNAIQENMKSIVERDNNSRGASPARSTSATFNPFGMIRPKSSRESLVNMRDAPPKALKMLGVSAGNASCSNLPAQSDRDSERVEVSRTRSDSSSMPPLPTKRHPAFQQNRLDSKIDWDPVIPRPDGNNIRFDRQHPAMRARMPSDPSRERGRSTSGANNIRSRSRPGPGHGPYRVDAERSPFPAFGAGLPPVARDMTPRASPDLGMSVIDNQTRDRNGSRSGMHSSDLRTQFASQSSSSMRLATASPSPTMASPNGMSPTYASIPTPPMSGSSTPITSPTMNASMPRSRSMPRKKTISKSDISEPRLVSSSSHVDTVELADGASKRTASEDAVPPPIPPINPKRRGTRRIFGLGRSDEDSRTPTPDAMPSTSPEREFHFPPNNQVRVPTGMKPHGSDNPPSSRPHPFDNPRSPERTGRNKPFTLKTGMF